MVGRIRRNQETDRIYIEWLSELPDTKLESEARFTIWRCLTTLHGPYPYDLWQREQVKQECERRGKPEIFARADAVVRNDPRVKKSAGYPRES
jgi:hypothetical protein